MEWQPIETAPRDGRKVLLCRVNARGDYEEWPETFYYDEGDWYAAIDGAAIVTGHSHWMPLLPPPTTDAMESDNG
jgi:hypothetical protein